MPIFRCFGLTGDNRIIWGRHIEAQDVVAAISACAQVAPGQTHQVEVWLGSRKIYPNPSAANSDQRLQSVGGR